MSTTAEPVKPYDLVLWGATSFVGRLVAEYLVRRGPRELRWALGGRDRARLEAVRAELVRSSPQAAELDLLVGDSFDRASLDAITSRAAVVCTTVGPYAKYGSELVASCVANGADYCDLTGEVQWIRRMIDAHDDEARRRGVRIVCCCGFDSIPSDLGTLVLQDAARARHGRPCDLVSLYVKKASGGFSGGTVASMLNLVEEARDREVRRVLAEPYALNPPGEREGPDPRDEVGVTYDGDIEAWTGPFLMAPVNTRVVRRSNALLGYPYGRGFRYRERMRVGPGLRGRLGALAFVAGLGAFLGAVSVPPLRRLLEKTLLPAPGEGPSPERIERGFFVIELVGHFDDDQGPPPVRVTVRGRRDPGYGATAAMLSEAALCLALDKDRLTSPGGVLTPASAMGEALVERLNASDVTFEVQ